MRISDWSSDVCSSDLGEQAREDHRVGAVVHDHLVEGEAAGIFGERLGNERDRVAAFALPNLAHLGMDVEHEGVEMDAPLPLDGELAIGRASCRERVCQYV